MNLRSIIFSASVLISSHLFAANEPWKMSMSCGNYKSYSSGGVTYEASKFSLAIGAALNTQGTARSLTLYQSDENGSYEILSGRNCSSDGNVLLCQLGAMKILMNLQQSPILLDSEYKVFSYSVAVTVPGPVYGTKTYSGFCKTDI